MTPDHREYLVQPAALAESLHDKVICPYSHNPKSQKYVPRDECERLAYLVGWSQELLEDAEARFRPATYKIRAGGSDWEQQTLLSD